MPSLSGAEEGLPEGGMVENIVTTEAYHLKVWQSREYVLIVSANEVTRATSGKTRTDSAFGGTGVTESRETIIAFKMRGCATINDTVTGDKGRWYLHVGGGRRAGVVKHMMKWRVLNSKDVVLKIRGEGSEDTTFHWKNHALGETPKTSGSRPQAHGRSGVDRGGLGCRGEVEGWLVAEGERVLGTALETGVIIGSHVGTDWTGAVELMLTEMTCAWATRLRWAVLHAEHEITRIIDVVMFIAAQITPLWLVLRSRESRHSG